MKNAFFCEACGAEVKGRSESCPQCGRSFLGIRCPRCGKEGSAEEFLRGCPDCGYMADLKNTTGGSRRQSAGNRPDPGKHRSHVPWPASRYLVLSALVVIAILVILYLWIN